MLTALRRFMAELAGETEAPAAFGADDHRLAAAALLVHVLAVDGSVSDIERERLKAVLAEAYGLDAGETHELIAAARAADLDAVDLYGFTSVLKRRLDEEGRRKVIEMMWEVVVADGRVDEFEDNVVWRVAELLGVSSRERVLLRKSVQERP